jgi:hypothetical protein
MIQDHGREALASSECRYPSLGVNCNVDLLAPEEQSCSGTEEEERKAVDNQWVMSRVMGRRSSQEIDGEGDNEKTGR